MAKIANRTVTTTFVYGEIDYAKLIEVFGDAYLRQQGEKEGASMRVRVRDSRRGGGDEI